MKNEILLALIILVSALAAAAQKTNDDISRQIRSLKAEKYITLTYDKGSNMSKIMVIGENFADREAKQAGIQAMNFGMAFFYPGQSISASPETISFSFWVLTKKPKFTAAHNWAVTLVKETLDLGDARYVSRPGDDMEYLNFQISRTDLAKIAAQSNVKLRLGNAGFTFTPAHLATFKNILAVSDDY